VTSVVIVICVICQLFMIVGQLLLKRAMHPGTAALTVPQRRLRFGLGVSCLTIWFFLWLGVLQQIPLSRAFPFEGINPAMLALAAWLMLKEKLSLGAWAGLALVSAGIVIVAMN
jgi:multidrug transporter EmrE-like cation transporter